MFSKGAPTNGEPAFTVTRIEAAIQIGWFITFASFVIVAMTIGGDAINGHESGGRYFLSNHGKPLEVSRAVFAYSKTHAIVVFVMTGLTLVTLLRGRLRDRRNRLRADRQKSSG